MTNNNDQAAEETGGSSRIVRLLDLARAQALAGDREAALRTARRSSSVVAQPRGRRQDRDGAFAFERPTTWTGCYADPGDLLLDGPEALRVDARVGARAMGLRLALGWTDGARFADEVDGEPALARDLAAIHGELGARSDEEDWIQRLDASTRPWGSWASPRGC